VPVRTLGVGQRRPQDAFHLLRLPKP
jgi:hypothetical protein